VNPYGTASSSSNYTVFSIGWANTQWPLSGAICPSGTFDVFGQVYASGLTEAAGAGSGIVAQLGYSTSNTNPNTWTNWVSTTFNTQSGNNDEFKGTLSGLAAGTYYYAFRYYLGTGCSYTYGGTSGIWNNDNGTLTVNPNHVITLTSAAGSNSQTLCSNLAISNIGYNLSGGATGATVSGLPSGVASSLSGTTLSITGTPSSTGSYTYTINTTGNSCTTASATGTISVGGTINWANLQYPQSGTICSSGTYTIYGQVYQPGVTDSPGQGAGITVQFGYSTTNNDPSSATGWTWANATYNTTSYGNNDEYFGTLSGLAANTYYYAFRYKLTASTACPYQYGGFNGGFWNGTTNVNGVLTVNGAPTIVSSPSGSQSVCVNGSPSPLSVSATGVGTLSYQWYSNTTASTVGSTAVGTNSTTYTPSAAAAGTLYYYCTVTNSCGTTTSGFSGAITTNAAPTGITTTATASNASVCAGGTTNLSMTLSKSGSVTLGAGGTTGSSYDAIFYHLYGGNKAQFLVKASELTALGLSAGSITSIGINMSTVSAATYAGFAISMAPTANIDMSAGINSVASFSTVYTSESYAPTTGVNTFNISSTPFVWNGTSNIIIQFCWSNNNTGGTSNYAKIDAQSFVSCAYYRADSQTAATICGGTTATGTTSNRPQF
jgi:hypothetical protein